MKFLKWLGIILLLLIFATGGIIFFNQPHTPPIRGTDGKIVPGSIASLEQVELGEVKQWILVRGRDSTLPVLLFLHGGPGMPAMYLAHAFQRPLEDDFVVVQWDRRGAGKTYHDSLAPGDLSVSRLLSDTGQLVNHLRRRFDKEKIYLAGHSFGSHLGILFAARHPELLHAYVGIGQVVDGEASGAIKERFIREKAEKLGNTMAIEEIESRGEQIYEKWLFEFGGVLYRSKSWRPLLWTGLQAPEYGWSDVLKVPKGSNFSSRHMSYDVIDGQVIVEIGRLDIPVYFFTGRHDYTTPFELVQQYSEQLQAPYKKIIWFDQSAHFPFFEQPDEFERAMKSVRSRVQPDLPK